MPISFTCPHCGTKTDVNEQYAGQTGPCSACGKQITIPGFAGAMAAPARSQGIPAVLWIVIIAAVLFGLLVCAGILAALLLPAIQSARNAAKNAVSQSNLSQINTALITYAAHHGSFPPAYVADKDGKPLYSWRVLILPYLEQQTLYDQFDKTQAWDSPANAELTKTVIAVFQNPGETGLKTAARTDYVAIVGPHTVIAPPGKDGKGVSPAAIIDGADKTIMVAEIHGSTINWAQPFDLPFNEMSMKINDTEKISIAGPNPRKANVGFADGHVIALSSDIDPAIVRALITRDGREAVDLNALGR